jgi:phosphoserine phosphatase
MLRMAVRLGAGLHEILENINAQLSQDLDSGRFVTAFLGIFEPEQHRIRYHSAGQGPLLHFRASDEKCDWADPTMPPLGVLEQLMDEGERTIPLAPGDWVILATDGFYEYHSPTGEQYGQERLAVCVQRNRAASAEHLMSALFEDVRKFAQGAPQLDDMTIICVKRLA